MQVEWIWWTGAEIRDAGQVTVDSDTRTVGLKLTWPLLAPDFVR